MPWWAEAEPCCRLRRILISGAAFAGGPAFLSCIQGRSGLNPPFAAAGGLDP
jgi:hypothetical protein